jgi:uncharacterized membrane protein YhaH (DUF805 family)
MEDRAAFRGRWAFRLTVAAFAWGATLVAAAFLLPVYGSSSATATSGLAVPSLSSTLVGVNGLGVLVPVGLPALAAAVIWFALHRKRSRESRLSGYVAWALIWLLAAFAVVAIASIGMFVLPAVALLARAAWLTPSGAQRGPAAAA